MMRDDACSDRAYRCQVSYMSFAEMTCGALLFDITGAYKVLVVSLSTAYLMTAAILFFLIRQPPVPSDTASYVPRSAG